VADIDKYRPNSGRYIREDGTIVNLADYITVDGEGKLRVSATVEAEIADSKIKGSPDGTNWVPIKVGADGSLEVQLKGSFATLRPMLGATKTATGVASEAFAGTERMPGRRGMIIKNEHPYLRLRIDGVGVTDTTGTALEPFWAAICNFDPAVDVPVYVISEAGLVKYGVVEW
jgi:hypothetical protein